jgi:hypothetical protein
MQRIRRRLTYANVMATLAVFIALGGTALASVIITKNSQVDKNTISGHRPPGDKHPNIIAGSINGQDIADRSGVDTCKKPLVKKFGPICAGSDGVLRNWSDAVNYCAGLGLRLPSVSEAIALATKNDVPGVTKRGAPSNTLFWTDEVFSNGANSLVVNDGGGISLTANNSPWETVCVTDPSA